MKRNGRLARNSAVSGGDDAFSELYDDRPKIIIAWPLDGQRAPRLKCNAVAATE